MSADTAKVNRTPEGNVTLKKSRGRLQLVFLFLTAIARDITSALVYRILQATVRQYRARASTTYVFRGFHMSFGFTEY
jgi:hypothetical protein